MIDLAEIQPGEKAADLGSGDGRILIALAKGGAIATGYELDDKLFQLAKENIAAAAVQATLLKKDFWFEDLSKYSIICCYPMPTIMGRLEKKLQTELKPGSRVLLNYFPFKHWKLEKTKDNIFLYQR